jgi:hypothetical protein
MCIFCAPTISRNVRLQFNDLTPIKIMVLPYDFTTLRFKLTELVLQFYPIESKILLTLKVMAIWICDPTIEVSDLQSRF